MKSNFKMLLAASAVALGGLVGSGAVVAAPVTEFYYTQDAGWLNPITDGNPATFFCNPANGPECGFTLSMENATGPAAPLNSWGGMRWTDAGGTSSAIHLSTYNDSSSGNPIFGDTNNNGLWNAGEYWAISTLRQENRIITGNFPNPLWIADASANLRIFGDAVRTDLAFAQLGHNTTIRFWETLNAGPNCTSPAPMGSICDDLYTITLLALQGESFFYNGNWYTLSFTLIPGNDVLVCTSASDPGCAGLGVAPAPGQIAVYTREGTDSTIHVAMAWQVPEPSTLALFGVALLGLGLMARRKIS